MRLIILVVSFAALTLVFALAALGPGTRFGLWDYGTALDWMWDYLGPLALIAAGLSAVAFFISVWKVRSLAPLSLIAFLVTAVAAYVPINMRELVNANPLIHDITTDFESPPKIIAAADSPRKNPTTYVGAEKVRDSELTVAQAQKAAFPDLEPLMLTTSLQASITAARRVIGEMGLEMLAEGPAAAGSNKVWRIEAVATTFWYGFKDDFIVRLTPMSDGGTRIDVRSKSRVGLSDLGANAQRVRKFLESLKAAI